MRHGLTSEQHRPLLSCPLDEILKIFENNHIDPPWSHLLVLGLDAIIIGAVVWCVLQVAESRRAAEQAGRIENANLPLFGGARFITGTVELAEGEPTAIRVTITQQGKEKKTKNGVTHRWTEIDRQTEARPFYLRHASGERIRVEPPNDVMLVDKLDQMEWVMFTQRRKRAELVAGERAIIEGVLERGSDPEASNASAGYRGAAAASGWTMKPARKRGMYVSAESLSRRHELRAAAWRKIAKSTATIAILTFCCTLSYYARVIRGHNVVGTYTGKAHNGVRDSRGRLSMYYYAKVDFIDDQGRTIAQSFDIDSDLHTQLPNERRQIWVRYVPAHPWATALGKGSSVFSVQVILAAILVAVGGFQVIRTHRYRRWYEGPLVESGGGPIPPPLQVKFVENQIQPQMTSPTKRVVEAPIEADFEVEKTPRG